MYRSLCGNPVMYTDPSGHIAQALAMPLYLYGAKLIQSGDVAIDLFNIGADLTAIVSDSKNPYNYGALALDLMDSAIPERYGDGLFLRRMANRIPRTNGFWIGKPGNGKWFSTKDQVKKITGGKGVPFKDERPDFSEWAVDKISFQKGVLDGSGNDFTKVYKKLQEKYKFKTQKDAEDFLRDNKLTPHHLDDTTIQLVPTDLHSNIPHTGSASDMRTY